MVAERHARATDVELAGRAGRYRLQAVVENDRGRTGDGSADGDRLGGIERTGQGRHDRGLGGAVRVEHAPAGAPACHELGRAGLATDDDRAEVVQPTGAVCIGGQGGQRGGGEKGVGDALFAQQRGQFPAAVDVRRDDHHRGTRRQCQQGLQDRGVEAGRCEMDGART